MADPPDTLPNPIRFGVYTVDVRAGEITKFGTRIRLQDRPFQMLLILLSRRGEVVTREELRQQLWPEGTFVDFDRGISSAMNKLRTALGDTAANPKFIETVGRRGYRFICPVQSLEQELLPPRTEQSQHDLTPSPPKYRAIVIATALAVLLVSAFALYLRHRTVAGANVRAIAVLPLKNLSNSSDEVFFSEGLTDELTTKLASLPGLRVISRTSVAQYKGTQKSLPEIARELHVDGLVQGSVLRYGGKVRITVQFVEGSTGKYIWTDSYERQQRDIIDLQNEVTRRIAESIRIKLNRSETQRLKTVIAIDPEAHDQYLRGRSYWNRRTSEDIQRAIGYFETAIRRDPDYAPAYAGLADSYALLAAYSLRAPRVNIEKARAAALKALELDDSLAEAHTSLALIYENHDWNWTDAEREYRKAIALNPNYATAHHWYAEFLAYMGRFHEASAEYAQARRLDPFSLIIRTDYAVSLYYAREYDEALAEFLAVQAIDPDFPRADIIGDVYAQLGRFRDAIDSARKELERGDIWGQQRLALYFAMAGQKDRAERLLEDFDKNYATAKMNPNLMIPALIALGKHDQALDLLEKAYAGHYTTITWLKVDPTFDPLRSNPRFQALLRRVNLVQPTPPATR